MFYFTTYVTIWFPSSHVVSVLPQLLISNWLTFMKYQDPLLISPNAGGHVSKIPLKDFKKLIVLSTRHIVVLLIIHENSAIPGKKAAYAFSR